MVSNTILQGFFDKITKEDAEPDAKNEAPDALKDAVAQATEQTDAA
jgi:hypothetical protein